MSRARNRADGDFGDLDITNIGAVSLDSIKGDADGNTSLAFSGSDVITITTGGTTAATFNASQILTLSDDLIIKNSGTIGAANDTDLLTLGNAALTVAGTLAATTGTFSGILKTDDATEATSTTDGSLQTDGGLSVVKDAIIGDDVNLLSDGSVLSFGASSGNVSLTHVIDTGLLLNSSRKIQFGDSASFIQQSSDGVMRIDGEATINLNASSNVDVSNDIRLRSDAAVLSFGADSEVTLTHVADTGILLNSTNKLQFNDASQFIHAPSATVLDIAATDEIELTATLIDVVGNLAISGNLNLAGNLEVVGTSSTTVTASGAVVPDANDGATIGTAALAFADLFLADGATIQLGNDEEITITHVADTGILFNTTSVIQFRDSAINIGSPADGDLDINADDEIELNSTLIDINGNVEISGTTAQVGVSTSTAKDIFNAGMSIKNGATSAGFVEFFEDSDNGTNKVTVIGPASTSDVTLTLPSSAGTIATTATAADEATALAIALG